MTPRSPTSDTTSWRAAGLRYHSLSHFLARRFGVRVQKISLDGGFTCPNVDGRVAMGGCVFCDNRSFSPSRRAPPVDIPDQIREGIQRLRRRYGCDRFLAYFQPGTNTYAEVDRLRHVYQQAVGHPEIVGLIVGTRPDCVPDPVLDLLQQLAQHTYVTLELGIQTIHNRSLDWMNRGHHYEVVPDAVRRCQGRGFDLGAHIVLGIPGETIEDILQTAREVGRLGLDSIKLHNLYATRGTPLANQVARGEVTLMDRNQYIDTLIQFLEQLPPTMVIERVSGDAPRNFLFEPAWCLDKPAILRALRREFSQRNTWQGKHFAATPRPG